MSVSSLLSFNETYLFCHCCISVHLIFLVLLVMLLNIYTQFPEPWKSLLLQSSLPSCTSVMNTLSSHNTLKTSEPPFMQMKSLFLVLVLLFRQPAQPAAQEALPTSQVQRSAPWTHECGKWWSKATLICHTLTFHHIFWNIYEDVASVAFQEDYINPDGEDNYVEPSENPPASKLQVWIWRQRICAS